MTIRGLRQKDLVERTGISRGLISKYVSGKVVPSKSKVHLLADSLKVSVSYLLGADLYRDNKNRVQLRSMLQDKTLSQFLPTDMDVSDMEEREDEFIEYLEKQELLDELLEKYKYLDENQRIFVARNLQDLATINDDDWELLYKLNNMNEQGKQKILEYVCDLSEIPKYKEEKK
jgi:transcriptional regulator with XRE-family HTH domain